MADLGEYLYIRMGCMYSLGQLCLIGDHSIIRKGHLAGIRLTLHLYETVFRDDQSGQ